MLCLLSNGCSSNQEIGKEQAIEIAKREVTRKGWKEIQVENASFETNRWLVTLWELPKTPGRFAIVEISTNGEVLRFLPGY